MKEEGPVSVKLFDVQGKQIAAKDAGSLSAGAHQVEFADLSMPAGMYMVEVTIGNATVSKKLIRTE
jgi:hypothetical protein